MKKLIYVIALVLILFTCYFYYFDTIADDGIGILTYHSINENPDKNEYIITPDTFEKMIKSLSDEHFHFLDLKELEDIIYNNKPLPKKSVLITFDDGYKDNYTIAYPILKKYNAKASIFLIGAYIDRDGFLSRSDIREMAESGIVDFGNHSYNLHDLFLDGPNKGKTYMSAKLEGESDEHYANKIYNDLVWNNQVIYNESSFFPNAIAYPGSMVNDIILKETKKSGLKLGFVGAKKTPSRLSNLNPFEINRFHIKESTNIKRLVRYLKGRERN